MFYWIAAPLFLVAWSFAAPMSKSSPSEQESWRSIALIAEDPHATLSERHTAVWRLAKLPEEEQRAALLHIVRRIDPSDPVCRSVHVHAVVALIELGIGEMWDDLGEHLQSWAPSDKLQALGAVFDSLNERDPCRFSALIDELAENSAAIPLLAKCLTPDRIATVEEYAHNHPTDLNTWRGLAILATRINLKQANAIRAQNVMENEDLSPLLRFSAANALAKSSNEARQYILDELTELFDVVGARKTKDIQLEHLQRMGGKVRDYEYLTRVASFVWELQYTPDEEFAWRMLDMALRTQNETILERSGYVAARRFPEKLLSHPVPWMPTENQVLLLFAIDRTQPELRDAVRQVANNRGLEEELERIHICTWTGVLGTSGM